MKLQRSLRNLLLQYFPEALRYEPWCSCGAPNHTRVMLFRVDGQPAAAVVPENFELTESRLSEALAGARIEPLTEVEFETAGEQGELGRMNPFENPFGAAVYMDDSLLKHDTLVFCPKMFAGRKGECFRIPVNDFLNATHSVVMPLLPAVKESTHA